jgi:uncharacterized Zn-finger protein
MGPRAAFEMPPAQPFSLSPSVGGATPLDYPRAAPPAPETPAAKAPEESAPALQPGGIDLPFDPRAQAALPFELPDDHGNPFSFEPSAKPSSSFELPAMGPLPFETAADESPQLELPGLFHAEETAPALPAAEPALPEAEAAPLDIEQIQTEVPLHIPCPAGHPLEVFRAMLGKEAVCPYCRKRFVLQLEQSLEYRQKQAKRQDRAERKMGLIWLSGAIVAAVLVVGGLIALIVMSAGH